MHHNPDSEHEFAAGAADLTQAEREAVFESKLRQQQRCFYVLLSLYAAGYLAAISYDFWYQTSYFPGFFVATLPLLFLLRRKNFKR